jgi:hypothetical protein
MVLQLSQLRATFSLGMVRPPFAAAVKVIGYNVALNIYP